ncbi:phosphohydrolase [Alkalihalobacillus alcalophilus ATCC 27647 = CGMCC 1.3604]|nr:HD domain-containing protein [Alkalihalobacillus alcalophilus]MED1562526.1 HD domain-containing protein [Alkalihalobacillus alcalophilus]THG92135.1 phosphohydrolase [Alkalihalobacillus alcalophilus ATCC 27647 = CGMCC 1.3604]
MNHTEMINKTEIWVKEQLFDEKSGHDWYHIKRVTNQAIVLANKEQADLFIVTMASLLHDIADDKLIENEEKALNSIKEWLDSIQVTPEEQALIFDIIQSISFKAGNGQLLRTIEAKVVQDADRLDAIGAIGIARAFTYSGQKGQAMYDPTIAVRDNMTLEEYRNGKSSAVHHFYEKLFKLKDLMNTESAKEEAEKRHLFMEEFLEQFYREWEGV